MQLILGGLMVLLATWWHHAIEMLFTFSPSGWRCVVALFRIGSQTDGLCSRWASGWKAGQNFVEHISLKPMETFSLFEVIQLSRPKVVHYDGLLPSNGLSVHWSVVWGVLLFSQCLVESLALCEGNLSATVYKNDSISQVLAGMANCPNF